MIDHHKGGFDSRHLQIYQEMKDWFWENGEASEGFREVADAIEMRATGGAKNILTELTRLRATRPGDYQHEPGSDQLKSYEGDLANHILWHQQNVAKGYIAISCQVMRIGRKPRTVTAFNCRPYRPV